MQNKQDQFDQLIHAAWESSFSGWDWSFLDNRMLEDTPSWDYQALARQRIDRAKAMLDIGTGGGELLSKLAPFPARSIATEAYPPSVALAGHNLGQVGVQVVQTEEEVIKPLPFASASFDLVLNRHADYSPAEVYRVLRPGGHFLTQQVGGRNNFRLNELFQEQPKFVYDYWTLEAATRDLDNSGFIIQEHKDEFPRTLFMDIGAVVFYLKVISWQIPEFHPQKDRQQLLALHQQIETNGPLVTHAHRFLIEAVKPG